MNDLLVGTVVSFIITAVVVPILVIKGKLGSIVKW